MPRLRSPSAMKLSESFRIYDCTMRHVLKNISGPWPVSYMCNVITCLLRKNKPTSLEIGALTNKSNTKSQLSRAKDLINYCNSDYVESLGYNSKDFYLMIPPKRRFFSEAANIGVRNISVITSVSNDYQKKNYGKNIAQTHSMITSALQDNYFNSAKVYMTCISRCPISGKNISVKDAADHIASYAVNDQVDQVTINDTVGTMPWWRMYSILDILRDYHIPLEKIGVQLNTSILEKGDDDYSISRILWALHTFGIKDIDMLDPFILSDTEGRRNEYIDQDNYLTTGLTYDNFKKYSKNIEKYMATEEHRWDGFLL